MRLLLVRHGETPWNRIGRYQGQNSIGLNDVGREQAVKTARALAQSGAAALYSSPLRRAMQTARPIADALQLPICPLDDLMELAEGEFDGLDYNSAREKFPDVMAAWQRDPSSVRLPGGETLEELRQRALAALRTIAHDANKISIAVTHNFVIGALLCDVLELPLSQLERFNSRRCGVTTLEFWGERWRLAAFNETQHLDPLGR